MFDYLLKHISRTRDRACKALHLSFSDPSLREYFGVTYEPSKGSRRSSIQRLPINLGFVSILREELELSNAA